MRLVIAPPPPCSECGSDPVSHRMEYLLLLMGIAAKPVFSLLPTIPMPKGRGAGIYALLERARLGEFLDAPDEKTVLFAHMLWREAEARGMHMREFRVAGLPSNSFVASLPDGRTMMFESMPLPRGKVGVWWLDTKSVMKKRFAKLGIPVAKGGSAYTQKQALTIFNSLEAPVVVKPYEGSASRHTTIHIDTEAALIRAFAIAKQVSPLVIIEEELRGQLYRPTLVDGKLAATLRRDPPRVIGDGTHSVCELVDTANTHPKRQGPYYSHIQLTPAALTELERQHMTPESVPVAGRVVLLHQKINWSLGGTTADVSASVHPDNKRLFEDIADVLGAPVVGIDFIISDISRSWKEEARCGVIECNSRPYFDNHHLPFEGEPHNVAAKIWDLALGT